ncbi:MAG: apolipoprotein N-acyltransferase [Treponema sp.]|jgi:apolipoprotein N-acyltransferase|nr:apolipoprotein N-acyltransferase [Treponema sp.]
MSTGKNRDWVTGILFNLGLVALGCVLFVLSFPNLLIEKGFPLFGWVAFVPVFIVIHRSSLGASLVWGALYGYAAYGLFNYWLSVFHPLAGLIVGVIYLIYLAALFFFLKLAEILFPKRGYIVQWVLWIAYEYLRTQGFLGYSYGISGYSQWTVLPLIQIAGIFGVWGVSALLIFPQAFLGAALGDWYPGKGVRGMAFALGNFFRTEKLAAVLWIAALCVTLVYGVVSQKDYSAAPAARIALVQNNADPWRGGIAEYRKNFETLRRLSDEALQGTIKPDMVAWSETAFVPRIYWHSTYRSDPSSWALVKELLDYLALQEVPFVIGNDDARKDPAINPHRDPYDPQDDYRVDYNAVMLYEKGALIRQYRKVHLVPFTEHFPYGKQFPYIYRALENADTHFWEKGREFTVFDGPGFKFSSPICFEDTFGDLSRDFVRNGAEILINLSNDAWSASLPAQNQHLSMAVFRAVENRRSMARATASGQTCAVDPNGKVTALAPPFTEAWITAELPIVRTETRYTRWGDLPVRIFAVLAFALLILGFILRMIKHGYQKKNTHC